MKTASPPIAPKRDALTGLRFFAAAAIVLWHSQAHYLFGEGAFSPFVLRGAVTLFFVLSGYVLALNSAKYASWPSFFVARVARVWPAHAVAILFWAYIFYPYTIDLIRTPGGTHDLVLNLLLLQAWSPDKQVYWSYNAPSWSVSCELFFYLMFPACLWAIRRNPALMATGCLAGLVVFLAGLGSAAPQLDPEWVGYINPLVNLPTFALGIAAGLLQMRLPPVTLGRLGGTAVQLAAVALAALGNAAMAELATATNALSPAAAEFVVSSGAGWSYAALIFVLGRYDGALSNALSHPIFVYLGEISYAIYLFHQLVLRWHTEHYANIPLNIWVQYGLLLVATLAIAAAVNMLIERPMQRWIKRAWRKITGLTTASLTPGI
jgi:peptidoglycan/LPS O-acetylase OafA/YrhL